MIFNSIKKFLYSPPHASEVYPILKRKEAYEIKKLNINNFQEISSNKSYEEIWAVDGSNKTIAESSGKAIELVRIAAVSTSKMIKTSTYIVAVIPHIVQERLTYKARAFLIKGEDLEFEELSMDAYDSTITGTAFRAQPSSIAAVARRFMEWKMIKKIMDNHKPDVTLKDGSLALHITGEDKVAKKIIENKRAVTGIVKNSTILSNRGINMLKEIAIKQPKNKTWVYDFIAKGKEKEHPVYIHAIKLNKHGRIFRAEVPLHHDALSIYEKLVNLSNDALYLGYPYILAKADKLAKIKDYEVKNFMLSLVKEDEFEEDLHEFFKKEW